MILNPCTSRSFRKAFESWYSHKIFSNPSVWTIGIHCWMAIASPFISKSTIQICPRFVLHISSSFILVDIYSPCFPNQVVKDHCVELMSMDAPTDPSTILELETEPLSLTTESFWDAAAPFSSTSSQDCSSSQKSGIATSQEHERKSVKLTGFNFMATILISILSILVGLVLYTSKAL